ncbi:taurine dioxygenase [Anderseniella sp. Alg231-50]|uniref:taurine dioxygenase n=1 Tax=Anderseniella sp. Alg231-50 TaxID=1922226 RepID=UPI000D54B33A
MSDRDFTVSPLTTAIGAEISGVDLSVTLTAASQDRIYKALIDHLVVFFRDQDMTPERHMAFAQSFGDLDEPHPVYAHVPGFDRIVMLANDASNPPDTDGWHTDLTFKQSPPFASILVARDVPPTGGDTIWSSMYAAYDALDEHMKAHLADKVAVHDMGDFRNSFTVGEADTGRLDAAMQRFGSALHNVVQVHPVTGRRFLYVNEGFTQHIVGMTKRASNRLLAYLLDHIDRPEYQVRFKWQAGSIAMWDNRCTQHYAVSDYMPHYRCMNRITVVNDRRARAAGKSAAA